MIELRPFVPENESIMLDILTDSRAKQTYMLPDFCRKQDASPLFARLMALSLDENHFVRGIFLDDQLIGFLNDVEIKNRAIEIGYVIHPAFQGCGHMTTALRLAIQKLFALGYHCIVAGAFEENAASLRVMEKCGMRRSDYTDCVEYRGLSRQCVYYSITKGDIHAEI